MESPPDFKRMQIEDLQKRVSALEDARAETIEDCAKVAEEQAKEFLSPSYASNQPFGSLCERFACDEVAKSIRALNDRKTLQRDILNRDDLDYFAANNGGQ